ncbi:DEAD/DEAH box helicase [Candidatus Saccharibacteria bacterium]|nr:DEAD/DEAH box helicase [Candidatus Saccharibacteria bacterium]
MQARIKTNESSKAFIIEPLDFDINSVPKLKIYLRNFSGSWLDDNKAHIPINESDATNIYSKITDILEKRLGCKIVLDDNSKGVLLEAENEERKFSIFSNHAYAIRNNAISNEELDDFVQKLSDNVFKRTLMPYQLLSSYHLAFSQNACNFSVPGSGKTTTVLSAFHYLNKTPDETKHVDKLLVVGPLAAFVAWKSEYEQCFGYKPKVLEIRGGINNNAVENALLKDYVDYDLVIVSYGSVPSKIDILQEFLKYNRAMVVLDEAHRIKNTEDGIQSFAALKLSKYAKARVILTGTPAANSYIDLVNLYKFIWPSKNIIGYSISQLGNMSRNPDDRVDDLTRRIAPFFIRVKKSDLGLPEPIFNPPINIQMSPIQAKIYEELAYNSIRKIERGELGKIFARSAAIRMRQAATNPSLLVKPLDDYFESLEGDFFKKVKLDNTVDLSNETLDLVRQYKQLEIPNKFIVAKDVIEKILTNNGKVIVWAEFVGTCNDFGGYLSKSNIPHRILYGATPQEEREDTIIKFANPNNRDFSVVIANPHAVGESISLHKGCHNAIYLEQGFNAGSYMQSKDRIHRVGLPEGTATNYYYIQSNGTVDETIFSRVLQKESKMLDLIEKEEIPLLAKNADFIDDTDDDIKAIIRAYYESRK